MIYVSIGPNCDARDVMVQQGLQTLSYPFDAVFSCLPMVQHCIETRFSVFMDREHFVYIDDPRITQTGHRVYDAMSSTVEGGPFAEGFTTFNHLKLQKTEDYAKLERRTARFLAALDGTEPVCLVYLTTTKPYDRFAQDRAQFEAFISRFPHVSIKWL